MIKNRILIIGKIPPPTGGVTIHVSRIIDKLNSEKINYTFETLKATNIFGVIKSILLHDKIHLHASNPYVHFLISIFSKITGKKLILTLHAEYGQHKIKIKNLLESTALKFSTIPVVLNLKSFNLVKLVNKNTVLDSAYIKPLYNTQLPENLESLITQKKMQFNKVFCTNAYNRVFDVIGKELYGIDEIVELFEKSKYLLIVCDPSGAYSEYYINRELKNTYLINYPIDFVSLLVKTDGFIRNTTTDGDSISVHEALFNNIPVYCTNVVDRPDNVILYKNATTDLLKQFELNIKSQIHKETHRENIIFNIYKNLNH